MRNKLCLVATTIAIFSLLGASVPASASSDFPILGDPVSLIKFDAPRYRAEAPVVITGDTERKFILVKFRVQSSVPMATTSLYCGVQKIMRLINSEDGYTEERGEMVHPDTDLLNFAEYNDARVLNSTVYIDTRKIASEECSWRVIVRTFLPNLINTFNTQVVSFMKNAADTPASELFMHQLDWKILSRKIHITWDQTLDGELGETEYQYRITAKNSKKFGKWKFVGYQEGQVTISGLTKGARYIIAIRPWTSRGVGQEDIIEFKAK